MPGARAAAALVAAAALMGQVPPPCVGVVGYNDMAPMISAAIDKVRALRPALCYRVDLRSTRSGPPALLDGSAELAPMGAPMTAAELATITARWGSSPRVFRIAHDSLSPSALSSPTGALVAADNPIRVVTLAALRRVFAQAAAPVWGDLGATGAWATRPVHRHTLAADRAIGMFLLSGALAAPRFADGVTLYRQSRDVAAAVAADPLALGLANLNSASATVKALALVDDRGRTVRPDAATIRAGRWLLDRYLLIYARRDANGRLSPGARTLLEEMLSVEGQAIVARAPLNYLPLNPGERAAERRKLEISAR